MANDQWDYLMALLVADEERAYARLTARVRATNEAQAKRKLQALCEEVMARRSTWPTNSQLYPPGANIYLEGWIRVRPGAPVIGLIDPRHLTVPEPREPSPVQSDPFFLGSQDSVDRPERSLLCQVPPVAAPAPPDPIKDRFDDLARTARAVRRFQKGLSETERKLFEAMLTGEQALSDKCTPWWEHLLREDS